MTALITGASTGIGRDMAIYLSTLGYDLILVARSRDKLLKLKKLLPVRVKVIAADLSDPENAKRVYYVCRSFRVDLLVNNAGIGEVGPFEKTSLEKELNLINLNVTALHILSKLFYRRFASEGRGTILNVASSAAFYPGPLMAAYYASKAYVLNLSQSLYREAKESGNGVKISVLCPGPVQTEFNKRIGVTNSFSPASSEKVAKYAIDKTLEGKFLIIPEAKMKVSVAASSLLPAEMKSKLVYLIQKGKSPL
ncbi:SDR family NAD(P)-dependent oxidoreductase [Ruminococcus sp. HUN007]|uniref:SDR family NAD(P)-dependent oxidoreductase n=1 Tax=Ruminococcus sp. HUN007 TaxID=1514668 RepID=UPI0005D17586|nr:SDR family NAD(P)-dependent oxidoreductase [Ruminococcus sp. HUN007]